MSFGGMIITSKGRAALTRAQNNGKLEFLYAAIGDGEYSGSYNSISKLKNELFTIPFVNVKTEQDTVILEADLNNTDYGNDFYLREIGIIVKDGDEPILYTYDNAGGDAQFISGGEGALKVEKRLRFVLKISDVANVTAETTSTLYTVQTEFEDHTSDQEAHATAEKQTYWNNKLEKDGDASALTSQLKTFTERDNITAGETLSYSFGKIKKWFTDLKPHAFQEKIKNDDIEDLDASKLKGKIDLKVLPNGALERCIVVADEEARHQLTTSIVQNGDTVKVNSTGVMYFVVDDTKLNSDDGYEVYTAGSATTVPWTGVIGKPIVTDSTGITTSGYVADARAVNYLMQKNTQLQAEVDSLNSSLIDSGWQNLTLTSNFSLYGVASKCKYRKIGNIVGISGVVKPKAGLNLGQEPIQKIANIPTTIWPVQTTSVICHGSTRGKWLLFITRDGYIAASRYTLNGDTYITSADGTEWMPFQATYMAAE